MKYFFVIACIGILSACNNDQTKSEEQPMKTDSLATIGVLEKMDPALDAIVSPNAKAEIIAEGFDWSEGPLWLEKTNTLIWSDVPKNTIYKWTAEKGKEVYLTPSGYTDTAKRGGEMGSNGLTLDNDGNLVLCQHGNRQMARMNSPVDDPKPEFTTIAGKYKGKRFSSPNDAVYSSKGELFFTDPPYGLESQSDKDPKKEISFNGVYKVKKNGEVVLLTDSITRPNGIAFLPGEKQLIVASSDPEKPNWYIFDVDENDMLKNGRIFFSAAGMDRSLRGLPDGFKVDKKGNIFASGPGGILFFNSEGKLLGRLKLSDSVSNCAFSPDQKTLYITNDMRVLRFKMRD
ncbi:MAG: SMP-30/gluconolactonase/LRE family protein [Chitinophagaceae bacterium]